MKSKIIAATLLLGLQVHTATAGLDWTTIHSRANCLNNESITWWYLHPFDWKVVSIHYNKKKPVHHIDTGFNYTWRAHAIHWGEGNPLGSWMVDGYHYLLDYSKYVPFGTTNATNCQIIEGW